MRDVGDLRLGRPARGHHYSMLGAWHPRAGVMCRQRRVMALYWL